MSRSISSCAWQDKDQASQPVQAWMRLSAASPWQHAAIRNETVGQRPAQRERGPTPAAPFWLVAARYASAGMEPYTTDTFMPAFSHTLPPCTKHDASAVAAAGSPAMFRAVPLAHAPLCQEQCPAFGMATAWATDCSAATLHPSTISDMFCKLICRKVLDLCQAASKLVLWELPQPQCLGPSAG